MIIKDIDVRNIGLEAETEDFFDYRYYPNFFNLRFNKDTSATDREFVIMFGLPSKLIELGKNNISKLSDIVPIDKVGAIKTFKKAEFIHTKLELKELGFCKESIYKQFLITRKMYFNK